MNFTKDEVEKVVCDKCEGKGIVEKGYLCSKCLGIGKLDWIENVVGKSFNKSFIYFDFDVTNNILEEIAGRFRDVINRYIIKGIS